MDTNINRYKKLKRKKLLIILSLVIAILIFMIISLFLGSSNLSFNEVIKAFFGLGDERNILIIYNIRFPRVLAAVICGMGLALSGCIMQSVLKNPMASPTTLGVSEAAVFGANVAIIVFGAGIFHATDGTTLTIDNPYLVTTLAFVFSSLAVLTALMLARVKKFSSETIILAGIAISALFQALTTIIQYFSTDMQVSSAIYWTFGNLSRAGYSENIIMGVVVFISFIFFYLNRWKYNALASGDEIAKSLGVRVEALTVISLFIASIITSIFVSFLGIIGFVGLVAPQIMKRIIGNDYRFLIISSMLLGALMLLVSDTIARIVIPGVSLPVGAITSLFGCPMFIYILLKKKEKHV